MDVNLFDSLNNIKLSSKEEDDGLAGLGLVDDDEHSLLFSSQGSAKDNGKSFIGGDLRSLIQQKERELHDINDYRIRTLEQNIKEKESQLRMERDRFTKLKEDFQYNLKLIEDRDAELAKYDTAFLQVKNLVREKDGELSDLKSHVAELEGQVKRERMKLQEQESYYNEKLKDLKASLDSSRWSLEDASRKDRESFDTMKAELQKKLRDAQEDLESQRRDMQAMFDEVSRKKHLEYQRRTEDLQTACRELEHRCSTQTDDLQQANDRIAALTEQLEETGDKLTSAEKKAKTLQWELEDVRRIKDAKIAELHQEADETKTMKQRLLEEYEGKMTELLTSLHSVEKAFVQQKDHYETQMLMETSRREEELKLKTQSMESRLQTMKEKLKTTEEQLEQSRSDANKARWDYQEQLQAKEKELDKLRRDMEFGNSRRDSQSADNRSQLAERDMEIKTLRDKLANLREHSSELEKELAMAKANEQLANEIVQDLKTKLAKMEREYQDQLEERIAALTLDHNKLVASLQTQRDRLLGEKQAYETKLSELENTVSSLRSQLATQQQQQQQSQRPQMDLNNTSTTSLFEGDLGPASPIGSWTSNSLQSSSQRFQMTPQKQQEEKDDQLIFTLQAENNRLSAALRTMRQEMEALTSQLLQQQQQQQQLPEKAQKRPPIPPRPASSRSLTRHGSSSSTSTQETNEELVQENHLLHEQTRKLHQYINILQKSNSTENEECNVLRDLLDTQAKQLELLKSNEVKLRKAIAACGGPSARNGVEMLALERDRDRIKKELDDVRSDLERIMDERDQLAELSNKLRSDLKKSASGAATAEQLRQVEKQVAETFQAKIKSVEQALEQIVTQNRMLKQQLRVHRITTHENLAGETEEEEEEEEAQPPPQPPSELDLDSMNDDDDDDGYYGAPSSSTSSPKPLKIDISTSMRAAMASRRRDLQQQDDTLNYMQHDLRRARADREEERILGVVGEGIQSSRQAARERLEEARRRLELAGKATSAAAPGKASSSSTKKKVSKKSASSSLSSPAKVKKSTKKTVATIGKQKIRNYNIKD